MSTIVENILRLTDDGKVVPSEYPVRRIVDLGPLTWTDGQPIRITHIYVDSQDLVETTESIYQTYQYIEGKEQLKKVSPDYDSSSFYMIFDRDIASVGDLDNEVYDTEQETNPDLEWIRHIIGSIFGVNVKKTSFINKLDLQMFDHYAVSSPNMLIITLYDLNLINMILDQNMISLIANVDNEEIEIDKPLYYLYHFNNWQPETLQRYLDLNPWAQHYVSEAQLEAIDFEQSPYAKMSLEDIKKLPEAELTRLYYEMVPIRKLYNREIMDRLRRYESIRKLIEVEGMDFRLAKDIGTYL